MQSVELITQAVDLLVQATDAMTNEAAAMPTVEAGDVVASQVERIQPAIDLLTSITAVLSGGEAPGDTTTDTAATDAAAATGV